LGKPKVLHQWEESKEVSRYSSDVIIKLAKDITPRVLLLAAVIMVPVYLFLRGIIPEEIVPRLRHGFIGAFIFGILYCLYLFLYGVLRRFFRVKYKIDEKKIVKSVITESKFIYWKDVTAYSVSEEEQFPGVIFIKIYPKRMRKMALCLPKGEFSEQVIKTFSERCSLAAESRFTSPRGTILTDLEYLYLLVLSFVYSIIAAYLVFLYKIKHQLILLLIIVAFGPGTLGCLFLYGMKIVKEKNIKVYALIFNLFGLVLFCLYLVLFELYRWSKLLRDF
jgi:hypothetical protein